MRLNQHFELDNRHSFLSPSKGSWSNYDEEKLDRVYLAHLAARKGTELHDLAQRLITLGVKLPVNGTTLSMYVNDAIGYRMTPEQRLFYSENCFGAADALGFRRNNRSGGGRYKLRIHDLKTGVTETSVRQLEIYDAIFCLEYGFSPFEIDHELRIYQNDEIRKYEADPDVIFHLMDKIKTFDARIEAIREEALQ